MNTGLESPKGVWWKPVHRSEKLWIGLAFGWCMVLFAMMPLWHWKGGQNASGIRHRVEPAAFMERVNEFIATYQVGEDAGYPIVEPPPGSDIYLAGRMWNWTPVLRLRKDAEYILHLSSIDVNHGFSLYPLNVNIQVVPGYDYGLRVTPTEAGDFRVVCNEFCGVGHHLMVGRVIVVNEFIATYQVGEDAGYPIVEPPPGSDIYLAGRMWNWTPVLRLRKDAEYILHLSSIDVNHGFSLYPLNVNIQVVPGYDYGLRVTPTEAGDFRVVCNEFCGVGHHLMVGRVIVVDESVGAADGAAGSVDVAGDPDDPAGAADEPDATVARAGGAR